MAAGTFRKPGEVTRIEASCASQQIDIVGSQFVEGQSLQQRSRFDDQIFIFGDRPVVLGKQIEIYFFQGGGVEMYV